MKEIKIQIPEGYDISMSLTDMTAILKHTIG